jgi:hypothetical protein
VEVDPDDAVPKNICGGIVIEPTISIGVACLNVAGPGVAIASIGVAVFSLGGFREYEGSIYKNRECWRRHPARRNGNLCVIYHA